MEVAQPNAKVFVGDLTALAPRQRLGQETNDSARQLVKCAGWNDFGPKDNRYIGAKLAKFFQNRADW